jgi:hypothetical protein
VRVHCILWSREHRISAAPLRTGRALYLAVILLGARAEIVRDRLVSSNPGIAIAGLCYLTNSFVLFLAPAIEDRIFPAILLPSFIGELSLCLWLLIKGVDEEKWREVNASARRAAPGR